MRSSKTAKAIAIILALLMLISTGVCAASTAETEPKTEKTTMDRVKEYLYSEDYHTYIQERNSQNWKDATGARVTVKAAEGYTYEPDPDYPQQKVEVLTDPEKGSVLHMPEAFRDAEHQHVEHQT